MPNDKSIDSDKKSMSLYCKCPIGNYFLLPFCSMEVTQQRAYQLKSGYTNCFHDDKFNRKTNSYSFADSIR